MDQIRDGMHRMLTGAEAGLVAYYQCEQSSGTVLPDLTTNQLDAVLVNGPVWTNSTFPCAGLIVGCTNLRGAWMAQTNSLLSSLLSVSNTLVSGTNFRVFGHDGGPLARNTADVPPGVGWRLGRAWKMEGTGVVTGDVSFDCSGITGLISNTASLRLLQDADGIFANAGAIAGAYAGNVFRVSGQLLQSGYAYTIGERDNSHVITATAGANGSITPAGSVFVADGGSTNFLITPAAYYHVANVSSNGVSLGSMASLTWNNVTSDGTLSATFAADLSAQGTPHWWLARYGWTNNFDAAEAADTDSDGFTAGQEYIADTDPTDGASYLHIFSISNLPPLTVTFLSSSNRVFSLCCATNLDSAPWTVIPGRSNVVGTGAMMALTDTNTIPAIRFYRVRAALP